MATKIRRRTSSKQVVRFKRKARIRSKLSGTPERPRLSLFRSNQHLYVQIIDDVNGHTLVSASSVESELRKESGDSLEGAKAIGSLIAKRAAAKRIHQVVFDRSGYLYHGRVRALAEAARENGLAF